MPHSCAKQKSIPTDRLSRTRTRQTTWHGTRSGLLRMANASPRQRVKLRSCIRYDYFIDPAHSLSMWIHCCLFVFFPVSPLELELCARQTCFTSQSLEHSAFNTHTSKKFEKSIRYSKRTSTLPPGPRSSSCGRSCWRRPRGRRGPARRPPSTRRRRYARSAGNVNPESPGSDPNRV